MSYGCGGKCPIAWVVTDPEYTSVHGGTYDLPLSKQSVTTKHSVKKHRVTPTEVSPRWRHESPHLSLLKACALIGPAPDDSATLLEEP